MPISTKKLDSIVNEAAKLFRLNGYDGTSIEEVVTATGINRYVIYNAFGGKKELFLSVLDRELHKKKKAFSSVLAASENCGTATLKSIFHLLINEFQRDKGGCLFFDSAISIAKFDTEFGSRVNGYKSLLVSTFSSILGHSTRLNCDSLENTYPYEAQFLLTVLMGLRVLSKNGEKKAALLRISDVAIHSLQLNGNKQLQTPQRKSQTSGA